MIEMFICPIGSMRVLLGHNVLGAFPVVEENITQEHIDGIFEVRTGFWSRS